MTIKHTISVEPRRFRTMDSEQTILWKDWCPATMNKIAQIGPVYPPLIEETMCIDCTHRMTRLMYGRICWESGLDFTSRTPGQ